MSIEIGLFIDDAVAAMRHCWPTAIHAKEHRRNVWNCSNIQRVAKAACLQNE